VCVVLDNDGVSSDEDEPLQKHLRRRSGVGGPSGSRPAPAVPDEAATTDKEAEVTSAVEEVVEKVAADKEAAAEEAAMKVAVDKEIADKRTADEATVKEAVVATAEDPPAPGQTPSSVAATKRAAAPLRGPNDPRGAFGNLGLSSPPFYLLFFASSFLHSSSLFGVATAAGTTTPAVGTIIIEAAVRTTLGTATGGERRTPEGIPEDVLEESEEPTMAPEQAPEVVPEEVPAKGAMIAVCALAPSPSHVVPAPFSLAPRTAAVTGAAAGAGLEVVLGHPTPYAPDDIPLGEAVSHGSPGPISGAACPAPRR
jgi:hypothetical protein